MHHYSARWRDIDAYNDERQAKTSEQAAITNASVFFNMLGERPKNEPKGE